MKSILFDWYFTGISFAAICILYTSGAPPAFTSATRTVDVLETLPAGGSVTVLVANDADGDVISFTLITVNPTNASNLFNVAVTGEVTTTAALDYETTNNFILSVRAESNGETDDQALTVNIINANEPPVFQQAITGVSVEDGSMEGNEVIGLFAVDPDLSDEVIYKITEGNSVEDFEIGISTGIVTVGKNVILDSSVTSVYLLIVEAEDNGFPKMTGTTTLLVAVCSSARVIVLSPFLFLIVLCLYIL